MCKKCGISGCGCTKVITKQGLKGPKGPRGPAGPSNFIVDDGTTAISQVNKIVFTDNNAAVSSGGAGIANVSFGSLATTWNDVQNIPWYVAGSESFKPQYTITGNRIDFRGLLYVPLDNGGSVNISSTNSYLGLASATLDEARCSIITNANTNNGTPQGRFMTNNVLTAKNFPTGHFPVNRDITFSNVMCYRRYSGGGYVSVYRSFVTLKIGSGTTVFQNSPNIGSGCIMVFSPFNDEYDGAGTPPLGNDPLGLLISRATASSTAADYISGTDNNPFTVPSAVGSNPFTVNAHTITSLGGFIINLEGLFGYLN